VVETVHRPILPEWESELAAALSPLPPLTVADSPAHRAWRALLQLRGQHWMVECAALGQGCCLEWAAQVRGPLPQALVTVRVRQSAGDAVRAHLLTGPVLVRVAAPDDPALDEAVGRALAALPALLLGPDTRAIHLADAPVPTGGETLAVQVDGPLAERLAALEAFSPQAVTLDVERFAAEDAEALRHAAPFGAVRARSTADFTFDLELQLRLEPAGFSWFLSGADNGED
jgi:hypothetical protein